jgi:hypothetical protein
MFAEIGVGACSLQNYQMIATYRNCLMTNHCDLWIESMLAMEIVTHMMILVTCYCVHVDLLFSICSDHMAGAAFHFACVLIAKVMALAED